MLSFTILLWVCRGSTQCTPPPLAIQHLPPTTPLGTFVDKQSRQKQASAADVRTASASAPLGTTWQAVDTSSTSSALTIYNLAEQYISSSRDTMMIWSKSSADGRATHFYNMSKARLANLQPALLPTWHAFFVFIMLESKQLCSLHHTCICCCCHSCCQLLRCPLVHLST
jgi:hypothetical protein